MRYSNAARLLPATPSGGSMIRGRRENLAPGGLGNVVFAAADRGGAAPSQEAERLVRSFLSAGVDTTVNGSPT